MLLSLLLALSSGALLALSFPLPDMGYLAWISLVPLFLALKGKNLKQAFWLAGVTGVVYYFFALLWITNTMINYGGLPLLLSFGLLLLMSIYLSLYIALVGWGVSWLAQRGWWQAVMSAPFLWTSVEWLRGHLLTGFPWANLGYSQYRYLPIIQIADLTGIYGIVFLIVLVNASLALLTERFLLKRSSDERLPLPIVAGIPLLLLIGSIIYGNVKINQYSAIEKENRRQLHVAIIQGNIDQSIKWDARHQKAVFDTYREMTLKAASSPSPPDLIVWPEAATPFFFLYDEFYTDQLFDLVEQSGRFLVFGSPVAQIFSNKVVSFNSALLVSPKKDLLGMYHKIHLVPFGEYVPLKTLLFFVEKMVQGIGDFEAGRSPVVMAIPQGRFSVLICYEVIFPELVRQFVRDGAGFLVNITNDAWFGRSAAPYQHIAMVALRAVENRVAIVRAANTGISGIIDPLGRITTKSDLFVRVTLRGTILSQKGREAFYTRYGDLFAYLSLLYSMGMVLFFPPPRRKRFSFLAS